ncbi:hypothetical protein BN7_1405 [Wickerhamomyces ciferrii]|uniref:Uncharacterized protein n=1 Tax=Wickerhamomyces ciferrii (strain ATCC 14091 / BCRC 22168 / CBS 111 / JCM 3599 / NBRC 0793 / NRRL Y-1031 F-60-10) TaxID=1206466 RepID=K0KG09_WICCF|nr:uncharacterized protein BN7_1405 [Wickerhamomyces ciferrii]CCH41866.1 hypothetical protein BN7_1405 [Wickerhamomyces ciferrii]
MLHKYNNYTNLQSNNYKLYSNTNFIDEFDQNLLYNSLYDQSRRSSISSLNSSTSLNSLNNTCEVSDQFKEKTTPIDNKSLDYRVKDQSNQIHPKKKDQSWLLLLILGA